MWLKVPKELNKRVPNSKHSHIKTLLGEMALSVLIKQWVKNEKEERLRIKRRRLARQREAAENAAYDREEAARKRRERQQELTIVYDGVISLIRQKKLTVTAKFMRSIKDPELKKRIIEATCISQV